VTFVRDLEGGSAAEFAWVLPVAILFLFGIIDVGRFMWEYNRAEKATQMGARFAAVTDMVPSGLVGYNFATQCGVPQGDKVLTSQFPGMTCTGGGTVAAPTGTCALSAASSCTTAIATTANNAAMGRIAERMRFMKDDITPGNVIVDYANSSLGFAGDPNGADIAPLITVRLTGLQFKPLMVFNAVAINMPDLY